LRILKESPTLPANNESSNDLEEARIDRAFLLAVSRPATTQEKAALKEFLATQRKRLADGWTNPREILTGDPAKLADLPDNVTPQDAAAWTLAARVVLNLDETMNKQ
jgi:hypothetical protein